MKNKVIAAIILTATITLAVLAAPSPEKRTNQPPWSKTNRYEATNNQSTHDLAEKLQQILSGGISITSQSTNTNRFILKPAWGKPTLVQEGAEWVIRLVDTNTPPPEPTVLKVVADAQAFQAHQNGFNEGFTYGVKAAEAVANDERFQERLNKAVSKFQGK